MVKVEQSELRGKALITTEIDPEIAEFEAVFRKISGGSLTKMEREMLRCYLYQKLTGTM